MRPLAIIWRSSWLLNVSDSLKTTSTTLQFDMSKLLAIVYHQHKSTVFTSCSKVESCAWGPLSIWLQVQPLWCSSQLLTAGKSYVTVLLCIGAAPQASFCVSQQFHVGTHCFQEAVRNHEVCQCVQFKSCIVHWQAEGNKSRVQYGERFRNKSWQCQQRQYNQSIAKTWLRCKCYTQ